MRRCLEERRRRTELDDPARVQQRQPAPEPLGETQVVGDDEQRCAARRDRPQLRGRRVDEITVQARGGSSAMTMSGSPTRAIALTIRCCMPPDSWCT